MNATNRRQLRTFDMNEIKAALIILARNQWIGPHNPYETLPIDDCEIVFDQIGDETIVRLYALETALPTGCKSCHKPFA